MYNRKLATLSIAGALLLASPVWAGFDEGLAAYKRGDYATAIKEWRPLAEAGDASAQYNLGVMYETGRGVPQDDQEAVKWYRKAAEQGDASAQHNLGLMYDNGQGVPQDYREALKWYRKAAEQGNAGAQNNLGVMYANGRGVPQDKVLAYALYNLSAAADASKDNKAPRNRENIASEMSRAEIEAGQALTRELARPGNFANALDAYLARAAKKVERRSAQEKPQSSASGPYPPRPEKVPGRVSCNTHCINADCWRTYDDGRKVKFRAQQKWNPLNNRFEWDAGPC